MKCVSLVLTFHFILAIGTGVYSQEKSPKLRVTEFYLQHGLMHQLPEHGTITDFRTLAKGSVILGQDLSGFSESRFDLMNRRSNSLLAVQLGLQFAKRSNPLFRVGFNYFSSSFISGSLRKTDSYITDTLVSTQTGAQQVVVTTDSKSVRMNQTSQQFRFDAALLFRTNTSARWSLYSGIGVTFGYAFNTKTRIQFEENKSESNGNSAYYYPILGSTDINEVYRNRNFSTFSAYLPLGVDFRIGKKREFWNRLHLFGEFRPSLNYAKIPELRRILNPATTQTLGIKVTF